jgi:hypothetical protein
MTTVNKGRPSWSFRSRRRPCSSLPLLDGPKMSVCRHAQRGDQQHPSSPNPVGNLLIRHPRLPAQQQQPKPMDQSPSRGPPNRRVASANTPVKLIRDILGCKTPTYYNTGKAWNILGYHGQQQKPTKPTFVREVNELWDYLGPLTTLKARRARAALLDALRTLGFRSPDWSVNR